MAGGTYRKGGMQARKAILEAVYEAYNRRDVPVMVAALDPQVEWWDMLTGQPLKGREAVGAYWTKQFEVMRIEATPLAFDTLPDGRVVVTVAHTMRKPDGQLWGNDRVTHVVTFGPDNLILRMDPS
jgi:ketosteroid isomerase-like protein